jgi:hypothetical protein
VEHAVDGSSEDSIASRRRTFPAGDFEIDAPSRLSRRDIETQELTFGASRIGSPAATRDGSVDAPAGWVLPEFFSSRPIERVDAGAGGPVSAGHDHVARDERIAVKEVLSRIRADFCFPPYTAGSELDAAKDPVTGADVYQIAYDRRRMRKSSAGRDVPEHAAFVGGLSPSRLV